MKKGKRLKYLVGVLSLATELFFTGCSSATSKDNDPTEVMSGENIINTELIDDAATRLAIAGKEAIESALKTVDEFFEERKKFANLISNSEVIYTDEFKSIETLSINWDIARERYEIVARKDDIKYEINLTDANLVNFLIHQSNCQEVLIEYDKDDKLLSFITECNTIKSITINACNITSLAGIENLTNLETLIIKNCENITDLTPIKNLKNINKVIINGTKIDDITVLANLPKLSYVDLRCNEITNPEVLTNLENISNLNLEFNRIEDIELLRGFIEKELLSESQAISIVESGEKNRLRFNTSDYQETARMIYITYLDSKKAYFVEICNDAQETVSFALTFDSLDFYELTDNLPNCTGIKLSNFPKDFPYLILADDAKYDSMVIDHCNFRELYLLNDYSELTYLVVDNCPNLSDVFETAFNAYHFDNLKSLRVVGTNINNFNFLESMSTLEKIELRYNNITDYTFLMNLPNLQFASIDIDNYQVDATPLEVIQRNGVTVKVTGYYSPEPLQDQEQEKILGLTPEN